MTARNILIGLGAGLAAALLFMGPLSGSMLALPLFFISPLPIAIAGLGFGTWAGAVAAGAAAAVIGLWIEWSQGSGLVVGGLFLVLFGAPMAWIAHLAGLSRPADQPPAEREWFPLDLILIRASLVGAVSVVIWLAFQGYDAASWTEGGIKAMQTIMTDGPSTPSREELEPLVRIFVGLMPFLFAAWTLACLIVNAWLGGRIARRSGLLQRPWTPLWTVGLPRYVAVFLFLAIGASFVPGTIGDIGSVFAGTFAMALALVGYGYVHAVLQSRTGKNALLWLLYVLTFLFSPVLAAMCLVGIADSLFDLRARRLGGGEAK